MCLLHEQELETLQQIKEDALEDHYEQPDQNLDFYLAGISRSINFFEARIEDDELDEEELIEFQDELKTLSKALLLIVKAQQELYAEWASELEAA